MSDGPPGVTISFVEAQGFTALGNFLQAYCAPAPITVVRAVGSTAPGQNVRVPEPQVGDFIVMSSLSEERLETNETIFSDNICTGSIADTTLTVAAVSRGALAPGQLLTDYGYPAGSIAANTTIVRQLTGPTGGVGTYQVSVTQTLASETLYAGTRADLVGTKWTAQLDVHGPNSANNVRTIDTLFRSEVATNFFQEQGYAVVPLYCGDAHQTPFENAEQEVEYRWVIDACLEIGAVITTPQMFADKIKVMTVEAAVIDTTTFLTDDQDDASLWSDSGLVLTR